MKRINWVVLFLIHPAWAKMTPPQSTTELIEKGRSLFQANCVACHGVHGDGRGPAAAAINGPKPRDFINGVYKFGRKPENIFNTISKGSDGTAMPAWSHLTEIERWALVFFLQSIERKK